MILLILGATQIEGVRTVPMNPLSVGVSSLYRM